MSCYKVVYKGGHHQIWCNGEKHIKTNFSPIDTRCFKDVISYDRNFSIYDCDCEFWGGNSNE